MGNAKLSEIRGRSNADTEQILAENNTVIMLMLSRLTLDSRKTSLKGISQIEFTQLLDLVDSQSTWDTHRSNEENKFIRS